MPHDGHLMLPEAAHGRVCDVKGATLVEAADLRSRMVSTLQLDWR
jgi:hypothetical protein